MGNSRTLPTTAEDAYGAVDPDVPLEPGDPRYVDLNSARGDECLPTLIARRVRRTPGITWHRQLVTGHRGSGKSTELKCLQGLLDRDDSHFKHVYRPVMTEEKAQKQLVGDLLEKAFAGSAEKLVMRALSSKKVSGKELTRIKNLLDKIEGE